MKASRSNTKFSVILFLTLLSTIPVYSENQSNSAQNISSWGKCKGYVNNSLSSLGEVLGGVYGVIPAILMFSSFCMALKRKDVDSIAGIIPAILTFKYFYTTVENRRAHAQKLINSYKDSNLFWQLVAADGWDFNRLNRAHLVERVNDKQLKRVILVDSLRSASIAYLLFTLFMITHTGIAINRFKQINFNY